MIVWIGLLGLAAQSADVLAQGKEHTARLNEVAPLVNDQTLAVISLDTARIDLPALQKQVLEPLCQSETDRAQLAIAIDKLQQWNQQLRIDGGRRVFFVTTIENSAAFSDLKYPEWVVADHTFIILPGIKAGPLREIIDAAQLPLKQERSIEPRYRIECREMEGSTVIGFAGLINKIQTLRPTPRPEIEKALATAGDQPVCVAITPPPVLARAAEEIFSKPLEGSDQSPGRIMGRGVRWIAAGIDPRRESFHAQLTIQSADVAAAESLAKLLHQLAQMFGKTLLLSDRDFPLNIEATLESLVPKVEDDRLVLSLDQQRVADLRSFAQKAFSTAMTDAYRRQSFNNLKQIGLAMLNFENKHREMPDRAIRDKDGKPLLSWRVMMLPDLEGTPLFKQFHLDEPWDSEHNRKLIEKMPDVYRSPDTGSQHPGRTRYLVPVGENLYFPPDHPIKLRDVLDGTSKTIMVVEADPDHAVIWTKPDDLDVDLENPIRGLVRGNQTFNVLFGDGSAQGFPATIPTKTLRALFTRNGAEAVDR
jgi:hypothetical protein